MNNKRILLADDHAVVRSGLRLVIEAQSGWEICGEASNGREALALAEKLQPDIVIIDIGMPELNGLDAARQIKRLLPEVEILIFSSFESEQLVREVFEVGIRGYLLKTDAVNHLVAAITALSAHRPYFSARISEIIFAGYLQVGKPGGGTEAAPRLSPREREIVQLLCEGNTNKEVATKAGISVKTIETHRKNIMTKLGLRSFSEMVVYAVRNHIIEGSSLPVAES